nr:helix-turn-helix domain-containing protein [Halomonas alimentaria]
MNHCYRHLSAEDRAAIMMMRATHSIRAIANHLGRAPSTVSREIARHTVNPKKGYDAGLAGYRARLTRHRPRQRPKLHPDGELFEVVVHLLRKYWSPQQIARTLKRMPYTST